MKKMILRISIPLLLILTTSQIYGQNSFYDFTVTDINGEDFNLAQLKGKKVLLVNTASKCGFTPQYEGLEELYKKYGDEEFVVIGFPANNFAHQEPGTDEEIAEFCSRNYDITFPMMSKISVKGEDIHPLYKWLTSEELNGVEDSKVGWNFQKYLIDEKGILVGHVGSRKKPDNDEILSFIDSE